MDKELTKKKYLWLTCVLFTLSCAGTFLVYRATAHYGIGISYDSVKYISVVDTLTAHHRFTTLFGTPLINQPPLYPMILALMYKASGVTPLHMARILNCILNVVQIYLIMVRKHRCLPVNTHIL